MKRQYRRWIRLLSVIAITLTLGWTIDSGLVGPPLAGLQAQEKSGVTVPPNKALLRVLLPKDAQLEIGGEKTQSTGEERLFLTPELEPGKSYFYVLKVINPNGFRQVRMRAVEFQAGQEVVVDLRPGKDTESSNIIFVPTSEEVVLKMLEVAKVTKDDIVYDLGCGDGRIVVMAAKKFGARGVGVDIDPDRVQEANEKVRKEGVEKLVEIRLGDALKVHDLHRATVVTLYMLPEFNEKVRPILERELKPGARVVAHDFQVPQWKPDAVVTVTEQGGFRDHIIYLYIIRPAEKPGSK
ncbi:MAG: TIGR03000 domain-containing protein [Gemmatales bacterium]|nr:TIGR03000 domain-containing protein [Gemmatales bacterium]MDW7995889.1 TIGR03000 domain-containing protein [Gemmatales bacterium]